MGKLGNYIAVLIFVDLLFIITGQIGGNSPTSILFNAIIDPSTIKSVGFWSVIIGAAGIAGLSGTAGVVSGFLTTPLQIGLFAAMALSLATLVADFISIYSVLRIHSEILAIIIMAPIIILLVFTIAEWLLNKD